MLKRNVKDVITEKQKELEGLRLESNGALDIVTSTINQLSTINDKIEVAINEINEAKSKLQATEEGFNSTKEHNSKIISKFKALIED